MSARKPCKPLSLQKCMGGTAHVERELEKVTELSADLAGLDPGKVEITAESHKQN